MSIKFEFIFVFMMIGLGYIPMSIQNSPPQLVHRRRSNHHSESETYHRRDNHRRHHRSIQLSQQSNYVPYQWSSTTPTDMQYKYLLVSFSWAPVFCQLLTTNQCKQTPPYFILQHVSPQRVNSDTPSTLDISKLDPFQDNLVYDWPDLTRPSGKYNKRYYEFVYSQHGRYCNKRFTPVQYFVLGIGIARKHRIASILRKEGISPRNEAFEVSYILHALKKHIGHNSGIRCVKIYEKHYIVGIVICYNRDGNETIGCDEYEKYYCNGLQHVHLVWSV